MFDLRAKGLKDIQGNLIIDNSYFDVPEQLNQQFDKTPERVYNAIPSALMFNFQATRFLFSPNALTNKVEITTFPEGAIAKLDNQMMLREGRCTEENYNPVFVRQDAGAMLIRGDYATECGQQFIMRLMSSPSIHAAQAFRQFWQQLGVRLAELIKSVSLNPPTNCSTLTIQHHLSIKFAQLISGAIM